MIIKNIRNTGIESVRFAVDIAEAAKRISADGSEKTKMTEICATKVVRTVEHSLYTRKYK